MMSKVQIATAVIIIYYFRIELFEGKVNGKKTNSDFTNGKTVEGDDAPPGQLDMVCLVSSISRPVLLIAGRLVGYFLCLVSRK